MGWLATFKLRRVARRYIRDLPSQLHQGWGGSKHYEPEQIRAAIKTAGLDPRFVVLGYAMFLPAHRYSALVGELPVQLDYEAANALMADVAPIRTSAWTGYPVDVDAGGGDGSGGN